MKLNNTLVISSALLVSTYLLLSPYLLLRPQTMAASFYQEGQCYLFIPRIDVVAKGQVVLVTDQEVVFRTMGRIWPEKGKLAGDSLPFIINKMEVVYNYLKSGNRSQMEIDSATTGTEISYSRANLTGIKLDRCGK